MWEIIVFVLLGPRGWPNSHLSLERATQVGSTSLYTEVAGSDITHGAALEPLVAV